MPSLSNLKKAVLGIGGEVGKAAPPEVAPATPPPIAPGRAAALAASAAESDAVADRLAMALPAGDRIDAVDSEPAPLLDDDWHTDAPAALGAPAVAPRATESVIDDPTTEPGQLYFRERAVAAAMPALHIPLADEAPADERIPALEKAALAARLLACDMQEAHEHAEPLLAYALAPLLRDVTRISVELQSLLTAVKQGG